MSDKSLEYLYLKQEEVVEAGGRNMEIAIDAVEEAFNLLADGEVMIPDKIVLDLGEKERGRINALVAYLGGDYEVGGIKWIPGFPKNPYKHGLPRAMAINILNDANTGVPLAVMDGTLLSAMRTGAVTGVGAKYLAKEDARSVGIVGAGVQARTQIMALSTVRDIEKVNIFDIREERAEELAEEQREELDLEAVAVDSPEEAVKEADIIVTATVADEPIVKEDWVEPGNFFAHIGSYVEEEYDVILNSEKIVVDDWETVKHRGTPVLARMYDEDYINEEDIYGDLDEIVSGKKPGRENESERIFFAPIGMAHEDVALTYQIYNRAKEKGLGKKLHLWDDPIWV